jgi:glucose-1-phosphate thymidylyltransferase
MLAGIRDILLISTPQDLPQFERLLGDGSQWGLDLRYAEQARPEGIAQAFLIAREFIGRDNCALILGDNIFFGHALRLDLARAVKQTIGATVFGYRVSDPERYGVVEFDATGEPTSLVEKPGRPTSNVAVTGLYFYDHTVVDLAAALSPSARGELEITDINLAYLRRRQLRVHRMGRGYAWFDAGTHDSLLQAGEFIRTIQQRQGFQVACPEEIAHLQGWIDDAQLERLAAPLAKTEYGRYLLEIVTAKEPWRTGAVDELLEDPAPTTPAS